MYKSCSYCGRIHDIKYECPSKPKKNKKDTQADRFRWTQAWKKKRQEINKRDGYMCQVCIRNLHNTYKQYTFDGIQVHHIVGLEEDYSLRLDDYNLLCVCTMHHKAAEDGNISKEELIEIAYEQERKWGR